MEERDRADYELLPLTFSVPLPAWLLLRDEPAASLKTARCDGINCIL